MSYKEKKRMRDMKTPIVAFIIFVMAPVSILITYGVFADDTVAEAEMLIDHQNALPWQPPNEPNEPENEWIRIHTPPEQEYSWKCSCGEGFGEMLEVSCSCGKIYKTFDILMKNIPTWPEYIELEKDLIIKLPERPNLFQGAFRKEQFRFPKGSKIYFKE